MRVLGIEGTAWAASAAVYDTSKSPTAGVVTATEAYVPESGGIHPREAAEHMRTAIPAVIEEVLDETSGEIDAVAFSRGPGLGPCLRIAGTAARVLSARLRVPLVGVNHMVAHLEIGRAISGFDRPVCLNASGANAHVLAYHNGRYRVLGETMDTGVGNAIDKFTRHVGWSHPGGPKVEEHATEGTYIDLPYVVKGMDFSFSGIMSAAKQAYDDGHPVEDVCFSLQENIFAMLTEVCERALSLTAADELVLGGGVGQNARLQSMLKTMCEERGAQFVAPEPQFLRDNAGMIAVLGAQMVAAGDTIEIEDSRVRPDYRPDEVPVPWRAPETVEQANPQRSEADTAEIRGAEALVTIADRVTKTRRRKPYRHPDLDARLRRERTVGEARLTNEARRAGVPTPIVFDVDPPAGRLVFERVGSHELRDHLSEAHVRDVGHHLARLHDAGFIHGDPTPRNVRVGQASHRDDSREDGGDRTYLIDFGLGYFTDDIEDYAMDLHVFEQALTGTVSDAEVLRAAFEQAYQTHGDAAVIDRLRTIEGRGRYQTTDHQ